MVAQVGLIYMYVMLLILAVGLGTVGYRFVAWITRFEQTANKQKLDVKNMDVQHANQQAAMQENSKLQRDKAALQLLTCSTIFILLSLYSLGVMQVIGIGGGSHH